MSSIEREILVAILKTTTKNNHVEVEEISKEARVPSEVTRRFLIKFHEENFLELKDEDKVVVAGWQR